jgi:hypothetical protein
MFVVLKLSTINLSNLSQQNVADYNRTQEQNERIKFSMALMFYLSIQTSMLLSHPQPSSRSSLNFHRLSK